jgi:hypothetical protein
MSYPLAFFAWMLLCLTLMGCVIYPQDAWWHHGRPDWHHWEHR